MSCHFQYVFCTFKLHVTLQAWHVGVFLVGLGKLLSLACLPITQRKYICLLTAGKCYIHMFVSSR